MSLHLGSLNLSDLQLIALTNDKIIPFIENYLQQTSTLLKNKHTKNALKRVCIAINLNENFLFGNGCIPLLSYVNKKNFRLLTLQLYKNKVNDDGLKQICQILTNLKYPPNEIHLNCNRVSNKGFNYLIDFISARHQNKKALSYPLRAYRIKSVPLMQSVCPLWLRIEYNQIDIVKAEQYIKDRDISVCYATNSQKRNRTKQANNDYNSQQIFCCESQHCIKSEVTAFYKQKMSEFHKKKKSKNETKDEADILVEQIERIMKDKKLSIDKKIEQMEAISVKQDLLQQNGKKHQKSEDLFVNDSYFENEFFVEPICKKIPPKYSIPQVHIFRFSNQQKPQKTAKTDTKCAEKNQEEIIENCKEESVQIPKQIKQNLPQKMVEEKSIFNIANGNIRHQYEECMINNSETPLFIMCDTCSILRMVELQKKSIMNYWECMLTNKQKFDYIAYFTIRSIITGNGKIMTNSESYQRKLRIEILPQLQLHLNTEEVKILANRLLKTNFKKLFREENERKNSGNGNGNGNGYKYEQYTHKQRDIMIGQMYRFVALFPEKVPDIKSDKHIWQPIVQKYVFHDIGYECPQELMPDFIRELKKLAKQYAYHNKLESTRTFTLDTLIEKAKANEFGFNNCIKSQQSMLLIPHTVTRELEHIKTRKNNKSKGDLWRVQRLCGSGGLLEELCKKCGCDILGVEHGEALIDFKGGNNDYTIISVAAHYSQLLNKESNLGFVLLTNDKAMYTIASGKGIPVVSLNTLNDKLQKDQMLQMEKNEKSKEWNASYLRRMFISAGFVGGFVKKHLINDAVALLEAGNFGKSIHETELEAIVNVAVDEREKEEEEEKNKNSQSSSSSRNDSEIKVNDSPQSAVPTPATPKSEVEENKEEKLNEVEEEKELENNNGGDGVGMMQELMVRRQQVSAYMMMESGYNSELFTSITLANDLLVTMKDMLQKMEVMDTQNVMRQMYAKKVQNLEESVLESQKKWSLLISDFQSRGGQLNNGINQQPQNENENENDEDLMVVHEEAKPIKEKVELYFDADIPEFNIFHADNMDEVNGHYVDVYNLNNEMKKDADYKKLEKKIINDEKKQIFNAEVPKIGGFLAGEELFERQANAAGFVEEVIVLTEE